MKFISQEKNLKQTNFTEKENISQTELCNQETKASSLSSSFAQEDYSKKENILSFINSKNPEFFEKFELSQYINSGSSGYVYKGVFKGKNKKQVAIKFLINKKENQKEKEKNEKNENKIYEINILRKLHQKNIIELYGYYQSSEINYSILEYGKYGDIEFFLRNLLKRYFLSETALNYFSFQILESLQYIHKRKLTHMDIKPGNILINSNLEAKITDFSISISYEKFNPNDTVKFPILGTGRFMSPEIMSRTPIKIKDCDKIDLYSLGVTLYYLFYADFPYKLRNLKSKDYEGLLRNIKNEELLFSEKKKISLLFEDFLKKILEKDFTKRINISQALKHPWIKGAKIISDEKENISCQENFMIRLITDNIPKFNEYIKLKEKNQM